MSCPSIQSLEAAARGDADDDTRRHLEACPTCAHEVDALRADMDLFDRFQSVDLEPSAPAPTPTIDGYELLEEIHRGAQGVVHRAIQTATKRTVAVKILLAGAVATERQKRRFEREIELVASLDHPAIVTVHDSGVTDGAAFLVMELINGCPLDVYVESECEDSSWTVDRALSLAERIAAGVACAHQHGVLHRDLKPSNILVDDADEPHIVDFGLALRVGPAARITREGAFVGTLAYASPEQAGAADVDARSDVYALGAMLHEMLTGELPTSMDGALAEVIARLQSARPRSIKGPAPAGHIDDEVDAIVRRALARDPEDRYQTAEALRQDLARYLRNEPIDAKRDSTIYVLRKTLARHRAPAAVAGAFLLLLVAFSVAMSVLYRQAQLEADNANTIRIFLEDTLGSVAAEDANPVTMRQVLDEAVHWVGLTLEGKPRIEASLRTTIGNSYRALGELELADEQLTVAADLQVASRATRAERARTLSAVALLRLDQNEPARAIILLEQVLDLRRAALGPRDPSLVYTRSNIARALHALGRTQEAEAELHAARQLAVSIRGAVHQDVALCTFRLGELKESAGDVDGAMTLYENALDIQIEALPDGHPDITRTQAAIDRLGD